MDPEVMSLVVSNGTSLVVLILPMTGPVSRGALCSKFLLP